MCLSTIEKSFRPKESNFGFGYKVLRPRLDGGFHSPGFNKTKIYKVGIWYSSHNDVMINSDEWITNTYKQKQYRSGFHIFLNKADAEKYQVRYCMCSKVILVKYKEITTFGRNATDNSSAFGDCVVAKKMCVVREV